MAKVTVSDFAAAKLKNSQFTVVDKWNCELLNQKYKLDGNIYFYIDDQSNFKRVSLVHDKNQQGQDVVKSLIDKVPGKYSHILDNNHSLCTTFKGIIAPDSQDFNSHLTLWQRKKDGNVVLLYSGTLDETKSAAPPVRVTKKEPAKEELRKWGRLGTGVLVLSVAGLMLYLWKKNRDRKRKEEQALADTITVLNAL